jgi:hypothetical protein
MGNRDVLFWKYSGYYLFNSARSVGGNPVSKVLDCWIWDRIPNALHGGSLALAETLSHGFPGFSLSPCPSAQSVALLSL